MRDTIVLHQIKNPYADQDSRNMEENEPKVFDNPCPKCGKSLDYEGDIKDMCLCTDTIFSPILDMVKPSHLK